MLWHPYTQHALEPEPLPVASAKGAMLTLEDGREVIDGISSWWSILHGHGQPELVSAMAEQAGRLDQVLFAGTTHEPAVGLAEDLLRVAPKGLDRVFYSDNGSTAIEVALKMVVQRWVHLGEPERRVFVAFGGGYHGDTFGAMAVGDPDPHYHAFAPMFFRADRVPIECVRNLCGGSLASDGACSTADCGGALLLERCLEQLGNTSAGVILEPRVQGAAGMQMHGDAFLRAVRRACDAHGVPLIADEVMTGFGRTGDLFATGGAGITPDLLCLAKGITGGITPLAATLCKEEMYGAFLAEDRQRMLFHGHTFTAHPIGCAVGRESLRLTLERNVPGRLGQLGARMHAGVAHLVEHPRVADVRTCGGITAVELRAEGGASGYFADRNKSYGMRRAAVERGVLLRPMGNVLYGLPPACTTDGQADRIAEVICELVELA